MLPDPLHPAVVHFPIVLMIFLPLAAVGALWAIRRGARPARAWAAPAVVALALTLSSWIAVETGESQEDKVEPVVSEAAFERHEEAAERFLILSGVLLVITTAGLLRGVPGRVSRWGATAGAFGLVALGVQVGHSGGALVYREGAASAYMAAGSATAPASPERAGDDD